MTEDLNHAATAEAQVQAEHFKTEGNKSLAEKKYLEAIDMYTRAIELDPDNAVYYSNRSAAFLAQGDSRGKALKDAEKCIELRPEWWKGYSRKGAAEHALQRYDAARATYNQGLKLDPDNQSLLEAAEEAYKAGQLHSKRLREYAKEQERLRKKQEEEEEEARKKVQQEVKEAEEAASKPQVSEEDALLAEFISEVQELEEIANSIQKPVTEEEEKKEKAPVDFGTSEGQLVRLLQPHYKWINLNPFRVLMLDTDATEEDIKQHYRKISTLVHPDKCNHPQAREAFEEVVKAYDLMCTEDKRKTYIRLIENTTKKTLKDRNKKLKKGLKASDLGDEKEAIEKAVLAAFAEMENRRLNIEKREAAQRRREAEQEEKETEKMTESYKRERSWAEVERREQRVGNWRTFQKDGKKRIKETDAHGWKEENRKEEKKFGTVEADTYKKKWK